MRLDKFVKGVLVGIAQGVKEANAETVTEAGVPPFALKNADWYIDQDNGSIWFTLAVESKSDTVMVINNQQDISESDANNIKFNVVQTCAIS